MRNTNKTINLAGGGSLFLQGVEYMPTDNVNINGGSTGTGLVGQIIAWTLTYTGGTHINQEGATVGRARLCSDSMEHARRGSTHCSP